MTMSMSLSVPTMDNVNGDKVVPSNSFLPSGIGSQYGLYTPNQNLMYLSQLPSFAQQQLLQNPVNLVGALPQFGSYYAQPYGLPMQNLQTLKTHMDVVKPLPSLTTLSTFAGATKSDSFVKKTSVDKPSVEENKQPPKRRASTSKQAKPVGKPAKKKRRASVKLCNVDGCSKLARSTTLFCAGHGGGRRCLVNDCTKAARGSTSYCIAHGGGRRCRHPLCNKSAQGSTYFCIAHGGGRRCKQSGCNRSARGAAGFCKTHGGGKKCAHVNCSKSPAEGSTFCRPHGGGTRCAEKGCPRSVKKNQSLCSDHDAEFKHDTREMKKTASNTSTAPVVPMNFLDSGASPEKVEKLHLQTNSNANIVSTVQQV